MLKLIDHILGIKSEVNKVKYMLYIIRINRLKLNSK